VQVTECDEDTAKDGLHFVVCVGIDIWKAYCALPESVPVFLTLHISSAAWNHRQLPLGSRQTVTRKVRIRILFCTQHKSVMKGARSCCKNVSTEMMMILWFYGMWLSLAWYISTDVPQNTTLHPKRDDHCTENLKSHTRDRHVSHNRNTVFI
jgi:hypothetical protein